MVVMFPPDDAQEVGTITEEWLSDPMNLAMPAAATCPRPTPSRVRSTCHAVSPPDRGPSGETWDAPGSRRRLRSITHASGMSPACSHRPMRTRRLPAPRGFTGENGPARCHQTALRDCVQSDARSVGSRPPTAPLTPGERYTIDLTLDVGPHQELHFTVAGGRKPVQKPVLHCSVSVRQSRSGPRTRVRITRGPTGCAGTRLQWRWGASTRWRVVPASGIRGAARRVLYWRALSRTHVLAHGRVAVDRSPARHLWTPRT
jgi:hypothetical protein